MKGIFVSYRRDDADVAAGRLADDLSEIFGRDSIFRDVDNLEPGEDYKKALDKALNSCSVLIVVIGPRWVSVTDKTGRRRLDDPRDWVRAEIGRAFERSIRVIPALLSGTPMPQDADLSDDLKPLLDRQAYELGDRHWKRDLDDLSQALLRIPGIEKKSSTPVSGLTETGKLRLVGSKQFFVFYPQIHVFVDNEEVTRMKVTDDVLVDVKPGAHSVYAKQTLYTSQTLSFEVKAGETRSLSVKNNRLTGGLVLELLTN